MVVDVELTQNMICDVMYPCYQYVHTAPTGAQDLRAPDDRMYRPLHPSIVETLPDDFPDLKHEFSKLESQMFDRSKLNIILFVKLFNKNQHHKQVDIK